MAYTGTDVLLMLGQRGACAHMVVATTDQRIELWVREGKLVNLAGCTQDDLVAHLSTPDPFLLLNPLFNEVEPAMAFDIPVLLQGGFPPTAALPPARTTPPPTPPAHPEAQKISSRLKRQTIDTSERDDATPPERTYRRLLFPARQAVSITLGRAQDCDVTCLNPTVSRKHCMLDFDGILFTIHDLGSRNGTFLNKERVITGRAGRKAMLSLGTDHYLLDWED